MLALKLIYFSRMGPGISCVFIEKKVQFKTWPYNTSLCWQKFNLIVLFIELLYNLIHRDLFTRSHELYVQHFYSASQGPCPTPASNGGGYCQYFWRKIAVIHWGCIVFWHRSAIASLVINNNSVWDTYSVLIFWLSWVEFNRLMSFIYNWTKSYTDVNMKINQHSHRQLWYFAHGLVFLLLIMDS